MIASMVSSSANATQVLALIAVVLFLAGAGYSAFKRSWESFVVLVGLAFLAGAILFSGAPGVAG